MSVEELAIDFPERFNEVEFFTTEEGHDTLVHVADIPQQIPPEELQYLSVEDYYWLNKPYSFALICHSSLENEYRYYAIEPYLNDAERTLLQRLNEQVRQEFPYSEVAASASSEELSEKVQEQVFGLIDRYGLVNSELLRQHQMGAYEDVLDDEERPITDRVVNYLANKFRDRLEADPEEGGVIDSEGGSLGSSLTAKQIDKLIYYLNRDYIGYGKIDPFTHDISVEDISVDGWNEPVFVHHTAHEMLLTNIQFYKEDLDKTVRQLAQNTGKGISKSQPTVDTTLESGARAQLTLGTETTTKGSNFTIRQFKDIPFTPVDLVNWGTYSLEQMALIWLLVESGKPGLFAGGTASGKTTTLNAASLYIDSKEKIVSIEDTPELELPQRNWAQLVTRDSSRADKSDKVDEYDLLTSALRMRPNYIVMGEVRGEEANTLFQAMTSGHTTFTTFHADSPQQVQNRLTNEPINISEPLLGELSFISVQREVTIDDDTVRRTPTIAEVVGYDEDEDIVEMNEMYSWNAAEDEYEVAFDGSLYEESELLTELRQEKGWGIEKLEREINKRRAVLAYLVNNDVTTYAAVGGVLQGFMQDQEVILSLIHKGELEEYIGNLRTMKTVDINANEALEELVPRPTADNELKAHTAGVLDELAPLLSEYADRSVMDTFAMTEMGDETEADMFQPRATTISEEDIERNTPQSDAYDNPFASGEEDLLSATADELDEEEDEEEPAGSDEPTESVAEIRDAENQPSPASGDEGTVGDDEFVPADEDDERDFVPADEMGEDTTVEAQTTVEPASTTDDEAEDDTETEDDSWIEGEPETEAEAEIEVERDTTVDTESDAEAEGDEDDSNTRVFAEDDPIESDTTAESTDELGSAFKPEDVGDTSDESDSGEAVEDDEDAGEADESVGDDDGEEGEDDDITTEQTVVETRGAHSNGGSRPADRRDTIIEENDEADGSSPEPDTATDDDSTDSTETTDEAGEEQEESNLAHLFNDSQQSDGTETVDEETADGEESDTDDNELPDADSQISPETTSDGGAGTSDISNPFASDDEDDDEEESDE